MVILSTGTAIALIVVLFFVLVFAIITVALIGVIAFGVTYIRRRIDAVMLKLDPVIAQTNETLDMVNDLTGKLGSQAESILGRGDVLAGEMAEKVARTADIVQRCITLPLIQIASALHGLSAALDVLKGKIGERK